MGNSDDQPINETERILFLHSPHAKLEGLTPHQLLTMTFQFFEEETPLVFQSAAAEDHWQEMPVLVWVDTLLRYVEMEGKTKCTPLGNLNRKACAHIYANSPVKDEFIEDGTFKKMDEASLDFIALTRYLAEAGKWMRKFKGHFVLTKRGKELLKKSKAAFFQEVLAVHMELTPWSFFDDYTPFPIGNIGCAYSLFLLAKYQEESHPPIFYANKYADAYPDLCQTMMEAHSHERSTLFSDCYRTRFFSRFAEWWGWVEPLPSWYSDREEKAIQLTPLFRKCFSLRED